MSFIIATAAYVQNRTEPSQGPQPDIAVIARRASLDNEVARRVWDLLNTPHTVKSLARALGTQKSAADEIERRLVAYLEELLEEDAIEVSPDT